jgi:hypothetical protein
MQNKLYFLNTFCVEGKGNKNGTRGMENSICSAVVKYTRYGDTEVYGLGSARLPSAGNTILQSLSY